MREELFLVAEKAGRRYFTFFQARVMV